MKKAKLADSEVERLSTLKEAVTNKLNNEQMIIT